MSLPWRPFLLPWLYDCLSRNDAAQPADLIFVLAGRMGRKHFGVQLYQDGMAPRLLLSVGRFEVSRMGALALEGCERLVPLRDGTPPEERNFFLTLDASGTRIERARLRRASTFGEALGLRKFLENHPARTVLVVSSAPHLRRTAFTFGRVFRDWPVRFLYVPVPPAVDGAGPDQCWTPKEVRQLILLELVKMAGYGVILRLPEALVPWFMRLRKEPS